MSNLDFDERMLSLEGWRTMKDAMQAYVHHMLGIGARPRDIVGLFKKTLEDQTNLMQNCYSLGRKDGMGEERERQAGTGQQDRPYEHPYTAEAVRPDGD